MRAQNSEIQSDFPDSESLKNQSNIGINNLESQIILSLIKRQKAKMMHSNDNLSSQLKIEALNDIRTNTEIFLKLIDEHKRLLENPESNLSNLSNISPNKSLNLDKNETNFIKKANDRLIKLEERMSDFEYFIIQNHLLQSRVENLESENVILRQKEKENETLKAENAILRERILLNNQTINPESPNIRDHALQSSLVNLRHQRFISNQDIRRPSPANQKMSSRSIPLQQNISNRASKSCCEIM